VEDASILRLTEVVSAAVDEDRGTAMAMRATTTPVIISPLLILDIPALLLLESADKANPVAVSLLSSADLYLIL
jgi:hypothetical protein